VLIRIAIYGVICGSFFHIFRGAGGRYLSRMPNTFIELKTGIKINFGYAPA
jgi:hypothetical protein